MLIRVLIATIVFVVAGSANAETKWIGPYTVDDVSVHYNGSAFGIYFSTIEDVTDAYCLAGNQNDFFGYAFMNSGSQAMHSVILSAQAQNKKIMVYVPSTYCNSGGQGFWGVKILGGS